ncbi:MAG: prolyl oligopeptidase family serine peptidase [Pseudomonadota bacterium]
MFDGTEYHYRVFVPVDWSHATSWPVILSLHGGGGYGSDNLGQISEGLGPAILEHAGRFPALVVFPQAPANGTPGWQAVGGRIALAALEQAIEEFHGDRSRVALTGMSIGGNGAWYLAYHHPQRFAALLVVCGFVAERMGTMHPILYPSLVPGTTDPYTVTARQLAHIPTWIFHGDADHSVPVEQSRRMAAALRALGAPVQYTELPGVDHNAWDYAYRRADVASWLLQPSAGG